MTEVGPTAAPATALPRFTTEEAGRRQIVQERAVATGWMPIERGL